jgi:hypothetical protein
MANLTTQEFENLTTQEQFQEGLFEKCLCGRPAAIRIKVYYPPKELIERQPELAALLMASSESGGLPVMRTTKGPMVPVSMTGACALCQKAAEKEAAKAPSWCLVEIERGPDPTNKIQSHVPHAIRAEAQQSEPTSFKMADQAKA